MSNKQGNSKAKVAQFFKKNVYIILMVLCVIAIAAMVTVAAVLNNNNDSNIDLDNNNNNIVKPDPNPDDGKTDDVVTPPDDGKDVVNPDPTPEPVEKEFLIIAPVVGEIGIGFEDTLPVYHATDNHWRTHEWVNYMASAGTKVSCVFDGKVTVVEKNSYYGTSVEIDHGNGFTTVYKLLDNVSLEVGDTIKQGDVIGEISGTALAEIKEGTHLHFALKKDGQLINPMDFMLEGNK